MERDDGGWDIYTGVAVISACTDGQIAIEGEVDIELGHYVMQDIGDYIRELLDEGIVSGSWGDVDDTLGDGDGGIGCFCAVGPGASGGGKAFAALIGVLLVGLILRRRRNKTLG